MFNVTFYTFSKKQKSTARPSGAGTVIPCIANTDFDILAPSICLNLNTYPGNYNYCYIPEFGRYYYCTFRFDAQTGLWWADCQVDALASWKPQLGALSGYVLRSAAEWDERIVDNLYPRKSAFTVETQGPSTIPVWDTNYRNGTYVVGIAGSGATTYYRFNYARLDLFIQALTTNTFYEAVLGNLALTNNPELKTQVNPLQYLTSIIWLPFVAYDSTELTASQIMVSGVNIAQLSIPIEGGGSYTPSAWAIGPATYTYDNAYTIKRHPQSATHGYYVNTSAAEYSIYVRPFGKIELDPAFCASHDEIHTRVIVDARTGYAVLKIYGTGEAGALPWDMHSTVTGQAGIPFQVGISQAPGLGTGALLAPLTGIAAGAASGFSMGGLWGAAAGALMGAAATASSFIGDVGQSRITKANTIGGTPCIAALDGYESMYFEWYEVVDTDTGDKGRPLCQVKRLDTLPGYQLVGDIQLAIPCTETERQSISAAITSGYFYE